MQHHHRWVTPVGLVILMERERECATPSDWREVVVGAWACA